MSSWWVGANRDTFNALLAQRLPEFHKTGEYTLAVNIVYDTPRRVRSALACTLHEHVYPTTNVGDPCVCGRRQWGTSVATREVLRHHFITCNQSSPVVSCSQVANTPTNRKEAAMTTLTLRNVLKSGGATYGIQGVNGLVRIDHKLFAEGTTPPDTLKVDFDGFVEPNADAIAKAELRAQRRAEREAKTQERIEKMQAQALKAQERAAKAQLRLEAQLARLKKADAPQADGEM
jgi:hypothetical protein